MDEINEKDREFISGVWRKVQYLEYLKQEEDKVLQNKRNILVKKIKIGTTLFSLSLLVTVPLLIFMKLNMFSLILSGSGFLTAGLIFEYLADVKVYRRVRYEN